MAFTPTATLPSRPSTPQVDTSDPLYSANLEGVWLFGNDIPYGENDRPLNLVDDAEALVHTDVDDSNDGYSVFNGSSSFTELIASGFLSEGACTVAALVKFNSASAASTIIGEAAQDDDRPLFDLNINASGQCGYFARDESSATMGTAYGGAAVGTTNYHLISLTYNGSNEIRVYLDGTQVASQLGVANGPIDWTGFDAALTVGVRNRATPSQFASMNLAAIFYYAEVNSDIVNASAPYNLLESAVVVPPDTYYYDPELTTGANDGSDSENAFQTSASLASALNNQSNFILKIKANTKETAYRNNFLTLTGISDFVIDSYGGDEVHFSTARYVSGWTSIGSDTYQATLTFLPIFAYLDYQEVTDGSVTEHASMQFDGEEYYPTKGGLPLGTFGSLNDGEFGFSFNTIQVRSSELSISDVAERVTIVPEGSNTWLITNGSNGIVKCKLFFREGGDPDNTANIYHCKNLNSTNVVYYFVASWDPGYRHFGFTGASTGTGNKIHQLFMHGGRGSELENDVIFTAFYQALTDVDYDIRFGFAGEVVVSAISTIGHNGEPVDDVGVILGIIHTDGGSTISGAKYYNVTVYYQWPDEDQEFSLGFIQHSPSFDNTDPHDYPYQIHGLTYYGNGYTSLGSLSIFNFVHDAVMNSDIYEPKSVAGSAVCFVSPTISFDTNNLAWQAYINAPDTDIFIYGGTLYNSNNTSFAGDDRDGLFCRFENANPTLTMRACVYMSKQAGRTFVGSSSGQLINSSNFNYESCAFYNVDTSNFIESTGNTSASLVTTAQVEADGMSTGTNYYNDTDPGFTDADNGDFTPTISGWLDSTTHTSITLLEPLYGINDRLYSGAYGAYQEGANLLEEVAANITSDGKLRLLSTRLTGLWGSTLTLDEYVLDNIQVITFTGSILTAQSISSAPSGGSSSWAVEIVLSRTVYEQDGTPTIVLGERIYTDENGVSTLGLEDEVPNFSTEQAPEPSGGSGSAYNVWALAEGYY